MHRQLFALARTVTRFTQTTTPAVHSRPRPSAAFRQPLVSRQQSPLFSTSKSSKMVRPEGTESFKFNHTMLRVKDPKVSLKFYQDIIGMELIDQHEASDFTLYFLAFPLPEYEHLSKGDKAKSRFAREGILELTHNHGTEKDANFSYANGNQDPHKGFGHIAISVDDVEAACERFDSMGVQWQKKLTDGKMKHIAFLKDPDSYWIEVVPSRSRGP